MNKVKKFPLFRDFTKNLFYKLLQSKAFISDSFRLELLIIKEEI